MKLPKIIFRGKSSITELFGYLLVFIFMTNIYNKDESVSYYWDGKSKYGTITKIRYGNIEESLYLRLPRQIYDLLIAEKF